MESLTEHQYYRKVVVLHTMQHPYGTDWYPEPSAMKDNVVEIKSQSTLAKVIALPTPINNTYPQGVA